jgi:hypothetical protein
MPVRLSIRPPCHPSIYPAHSFIQVPVTLRQYFFLNLHTNELITIATVALPYSHAELIKYTSDVLNPWHITQKFRIVAMLLTVVLQTVLHTERLGTFTMSP